MELKEKNCACESCYHGARCSKPSISALLGVKSVSTPKGKISRLTRARHSSLGVLV